MPALSPLPRMDGQGPQAMVPWGPGAAPPQGCGVPGHAPSCPCSGSSGATSRAAGCLGAAGQHPVSGAVRRTCCLGGLLSLQPHNVIGLLGVVLEASEFNIPTLGVGVNNFGRQRGSMQAERSNPARKPGWTTQGCPGAASEQGLDQLHLHTWAGQPRLQGSRPSFSVPQWDTGLRVQMLSRTPSPPSKLSRGLWPNPWTVAVGQPHVGDAVAGRTVPSLCPLAGRSQAWSTTQEGRILQGQAAPVLLMKAGLRLSRETASERGHLDAEPVGGDTVHACTHGQTTQPLRTGAFLGRGQAV